MPQIVVRTSGPESTLGAEVLRERVATSDLESEQFAAQLVERIGWALADADTIEERPPRPGDGRGGPSIPPAG